MSRKACRSAVRPIGWLPMIIALTSMVASAQLPGRPSAPKQTADTAGHSGDSLGRDTPRGTVMGFLRAAQDSDFERAAQFLQLSHNERSGEGPRLAGRLAALMDFAFVGRAGPLSDRPEGPGGAGSSRDRIGTFRIHGREANVELVRVSNVEDHDVWLFSAQTLADVPELFEELQTSNIEPNLPAFLVNERVLSTPLWGWLAFLLLIPVAIAAAWTLVRLARFWHRRWLERRGQPVPPDDRHSLAAPSILILTVLLHQVGVVSLGLPLIFRLYNYRLAGLLIAAGAAWLVFRLINRWSDRARSNALAGTPNRSGAVMLLGQRLLKVVVVIVAGLVMLSTLGVNTTAAVAGLGIGSLAIAFAAQKTLENLLGGISILGDEVIRVGELCQIGDKQGTVEDISLRSTRIRTLDRTELSIPNGQLAMMSVENLSRRDMMRFRTTLRLRLETSPDQLRSLLSEMQELLNHDPRLMRDGATVRFVGFGDGSLNVEVNCNVLTTDGSEFQRIREALLLRIVELVSEAGTGFASPTPTLVVTPPDRDAIRRRAG
jgi:MscS family membrane protein